jgi:uncharacterized protein
LEFKKVVSSVDQQLADSNSINPYDNPPAADNPMNWLDPRFVHAQAISGLIVCVVILLPGLLGLAVWWFVEGLGFYFYLATAGYALVAMLLAFFSFVWPRISFRHSRWRLDEESFEIHRGVLWRHRICIPLGRVQHADVAQGPILRTYDLGSLIIHTAGSQHSMVQLDGLSHSVAMQLRDRLVQQAQSRTVL